MYWECRICCIKTMCVYGSGVGDKGMTGKHRHLTVAVVGAAAVKVC